ncbi:MAG TPA: cell division protein FtsZ, partial [Massilia sp.]|nr:cell division protein FtsZ [Massilia sp.]
SAEHAGDDRAAKAAAEAIACPLLDGANLRAARGVLVNIAASEETLKLRETKLVMNTVCAQTNDDAIIKFGAVYDETLGDAMRVTVVATGLTRPSDLAAGTRRLSVPWPGAPSQPVLRQGGMHAQVRQGAAQYESRAGASSRQSAGPGGEDGQPG